MELRILQREVWVSKHAQKGWGAQSIDRISKKLQYKNTDGEWVDVPIHSEFINVTENNISTGVDF